MHISISAIHCPTYFPSFSVHTAAQCQGRAPVVLWTWNPNQRDYITLVTIKYMWQLIRSTKIIPSWKVLLHVIFQNDRWMSKLISMSFYRCPKVSLNQPNEYELETTTSHCSTRTCAGFHCNVALPHYVIHSLWWKGGLPQTHPKEWLLNMLKGHDDGTALQAILSLVWL